MNQKCLLTAALGVAPANVHAQSSVTLFGLLDNGVTYFSNEHG